MDFPDITYGQNFLHINTTSSRADRASCSSNFRWPTCKPAKASAFCLPSSTTRTCGSPAQNVQGDEFYWAAHVTTRRCASTRRRGGDANYAWRERDVVNWPRVSTTTQQMSPPKRPTRDDWISEDHRIIGATRVGTQLWFAWTAASGDGGYGGFKFPFPHVQVAKFDIAQDYKRVDQMQVWNA